MLARWAAGDMTRGARGLLGKEGCWLAGFVGPRAVHATPGALIQERGAPVDESRPAVLLAPARGQVHEVDRGGAVDGTLRARRAIPDPGECAPITSTFDR